MTLLFNYTYKNIFARKLTATLTIFGIALVVFVFCAVLMLSNGMNRTLVGTGEDDNAIVIRRASQTEVQSIIYRDMANAIRAEVGIAKDSDGTPIVTSEILVLINQPKRDTEEPSNVPVRGVSDRSISMRSAFKIIEGRMWQPGTSEIIAGVKAGRSFQGCGLGETVRFGMRDWTVVGQFETDGSGFESELWGDVDQMMDAFGRPVFSSLTMRLDSPSEFNEFKTRLEGDPRYTVEVWREKEYYEEQSKFTTIFINALGVTISIIFSLGAIVGAMITMYAAVANRTVEIGTLRALGFSRRAVLQAFLVESLMIAILGGILGVLAASFLRFVEVSTTNWNTFAELAFSFELSGQIVWYALIFAVIMGFVGGFLPAVRAARFRTVNALRSK